MASETERHKNKTASKGRKTRSSAQETAEKSSPEAGPDGKKPARTRKTPTKTAATPSRRPRETVDAASQRRPARKSAPSPAAAQAAAPDTSPAAPAPEASRSPLALSQNAPTAQKLAENIERIEALGQRLVAALSAGPQRDPGVEGPGPDLYLTAAGALFKTMAEQPARVIEHQMNYWGETLKHYARAQATLASGSLTAPVDEGEDAPRDKRFKNPLWQSHPYFNYVMKQYQINAQAIRDAARDLDLPDQTARRRIDWLTNQIVDMMAPTNFLATNPDALERAIETEGESLVQGLENLVSDIEQHGGEMIVSLADRNAFSVGKNIGTTPGSVVHRTPLFELLQFNPTTPQVHAVPMLIFPPWINKFYILDLKPQNSLIRWLLDQGHSLFIVSWKNPDASYADTGMEDYIAAYLEAMDKVRELTGQQRLNAVGYCIAGTTLSLVLALLKQRGDERVNSATFLTTLTDFSDHGEFTTFLHDDFVNGIGEEVARHGILPAPLMSRTMSFLRPNDLVWGPAIRSYMMGETPPAFDLLFWNGDSTNLPGRMAMQYLRQLCQQNAFATEGIELMGHRLHISDVTVPLCSVACEGDHIAPWKDCWRGVAQMGSDDKSFILSESGHVAGIVNPPTRQKYGHYADGGGFGGDFQDWRDSACYTASSWWPSWGEWLSGRAGESVPARDPGPGLGPAPGDYVHERAI